MILNLLYFALIFLVFSISIIFLALSMKIIMNIQPNTSKKEYDDLHINASVLSGKLAEAKKYPCRNTKDLGYCNDCEMEGFCVLSHNYAK